MKIISFDVGIKNMAYCVIDAQSLINYSIDAWNVLNFTQAENDGGAPIMAKVCGQPIGEKTTAKKSKKSLSLATSANVARICGKKAKYEKNSCFYCEMHAKKNGEYWIPKKDYSLSFLKKQNVGALYEIAKRDFFMYDADKKYKKQEMISTLDELYTKKCYLPVSVVKNKRAGDMDLIYIGRAMKRTLDAEINVEELTHVVIENQISPIATRMKTIQGMLAQYFIMKKENLVISFISSANKLKGLVSRAGGGEGGVQDGNNEVTVPVPAPSAKQKGIHPVNRNYKENKKDSVAICSQMLETNEALNVWKPKFTTSTKKDDLADCFLQGIYYLSTLK